MDPIVQLSHALEFYGNIPFTEKFLAQSACDLTTKTIQEQLALVTLPHYRRYMNEEVRPIYLLPALKCILQERRQIYWTMMGADTNHTAWQALTSLFRIQAEPRPIKIKVGGPHHGEIDDPAAYILSLLAPDEVQQALAPSTIKAFTAWLQSLSLSQRQQLDNAAGANAGSFQRTWTHLSKRQLITILASVEMHPFLQIRWREVSPRYLEIMSLFENTNCTGMAFEEDWFCSESDPGTQMLQRIKVRYLGKTRQYQTDPSVVHPTTFDLLRHAFSEILGEHVIQLKKDGFQYWPMQGLNIILEHSTLSEQLRQNSLFWENGLWSGRTYLALAFAIHAFRQDAQWKFGVHTSYPYIRNIGTLADIQTSRTLEGVEDVQGLGTSLKSSASDHYLLVPYEHWLKERQGRNRPTHEERQEFHRLLQQVIHEVQPYEAEDLQQFFSIELLLRLYLREPDPRHPNEDHITFKHVLHLLYFDQMTRVGFRTIYFSLQQFFTDLMKAEQDARYAPLFQQLRLLDMGIRPAEEVAMVKLWLCYRPLAREQAQAGIKAIQQHLPLVQEYLNDKVSFTFLLERIIPAVGVIDVTSYRSLLSQCKFDEDDG
jgi:hypothetical protein